MANYEPPTEDLPIFDNSVFVSKDTPVTIEYANKHYLKYPNAQGTENLLAINVAGLASMLAGVDIADGTNKTNIDQSGANIVIDNNVNNGTLIYKANNNSGVETTVLTVDPSNMTIQTTNPPTQTATQPEASDSSNKIPTTSWVQSVITRLLTLSNNWTGLNTFSRTYFTASNNALPVARITYSPAAGEPSISSNGLSMVNCTIQQTGAASLTNISNSMTNINLIQSASLTVASNGTVAWVANNSPSTGYLMGCANNKNLNLLTVVDNVSSFIFTYNYNGAFAITPPITNSSTMPASSDSSTRVPTTAWVQSAIAANSGGANLTKNSYTVSPTSNVLSYTSGIFNNYNTGATIGYVSRESTYINSSVGYLTRNPLIISITNSASAFPNSSVVGNQTPTFSPLTNPVKISIDVFMYNNAGSTGYIRTKLMLLPSCCFTVQNQSWTGWGKYNISTETNGPSYFQNYAYALDNRINGNSAFTNNDATYCPYKVSGNVPTPPSPALVASPSFTGRQCWSYDTSISSGLGISILGMTYGPTNGTNNIYVWFSGFTADNTTVFNVNAKIEDSSGANIMNNGIASSVSLSYLIPPPQP